MKQPSENRQRSRAVRPAKSGRKYELVDQFAVKSVAFKLCGVPRYTLEEVAEP